MIRSGHQLAWSENCPFQNSTKIFTYFSKKLSLTAVDKIESKNGLGRMDKWTKHMFFNQVMVL